MVDGILKKILSLILLFTLCGCNQEQPKIYIFYHQTCGSCRAMQEYFIPQIPKEIEVILLDIDNEENIDYYHQVLDRFEDIDQSLYEQVMTPFLYYEGKFCAIGYERVMDEVYIQLINESLNHQKYTIIPSGVWIEKGE